MCPVTTEVVFKYRQTIIHRIPHAMNALCIRQDYLDQTNSKEIVRHFICYKFRIFRMLTNPIYVIRPCFSKHIKNALTIYLLAFLSTIIFPFPIHAHYIFPTLTVLVFLLSSLFSQKPILLLLISSIFWLSPTILKKHFKTAFRTPAQTTQCAKSFCQEEKEPIFVAVQADNHPYHYGPEFRFLLKDQGCQVYDIEKEPDSAQKMAIVVDNSSYEHQETNFYELDLFGSSNQDYVFSCQENLKIHLLSKTKTAY